MRHEYDDEQIFESNKIAARTTGRDWISRFNLRDVRAILDALPEPDQKPVTVDYSMAEDVWDRARYKTGLGENSARYADLIPESQGLLVTALQLFADDQINSAPVADEWEQCEPDELRKDDRYLVKGDGWSYEGVVNSPYVDILCIHPATGSRLTKAMVKHRRTGVHLYRIPAPVEHPDPEQHPVILIPRFNGVDKEPHLKPFFWNGQHYQSFSAPEYFSVQMITDWSPAKVVSDND